MNPYTGDLRRLLAVSALALPPGLERVPSQLEKAAQLKLGNSFATRVNLRSNHPLARWAKERRDAHRSQKASRTAKKRKAKIAATSRRRNRK